MAEHDPSVLSLFGDSDIKAYNSAGARCAQTESAVELAVGEEFSEIIVTGHPAAFSKRNELKPYEFERAQPGYTRLGFSGYARCFGKSDRAPIAEKKKRFVHGSR